MHRHRRSISRPRLRQRINHTALLIANQRETETLFAINIQGQSVVARIDDEVSVLISSSERAKGERQRKCLRRTSGNVMEPGV
jgi:hypothetical protein